MKKKKIKEAEDDVEPLVKAKESHAVDTMKKADDDGESSFVKQNDKVDNAVDEKSVIEKPNQEFKFERHNLDEEVEKSVKDDNDEKLQNSLV